jgi:hypothetical protein
MKCVSIHVSGLKKLMKKEDTRIMDMLPIILAEAIGTAILVFVGCMGCVGSMGTSRTLMQISLAFGIAVMIAIQVRIVPALASITITVIIFSMPFFSVRWSHQRCAHQSVHHVGRGDPWQQISAVGRTLHRRAIVRQSDRLWTAEGQ